MLLFLLLETTLLLPTLAEGKKRKKGRDGGGGRGGKGRAVGEGRKGQKWDAIKDELKIFFSPEQGRQ